MDVCVEKGKVDVQFLKLRTGEFTVESIRVLDLSREKIHDVGALGLCLSLEILNLSCNDVTRLCGLNTLVNLSHLDLAANRIADLEGLHCLDNLVYLNVAGNLITRHSAIACLAMLPRLKTVYFEQTRPVAAVGPAAAPSGDAASDGFGDRPRSGELHLYTNPICRAVSYRKDINDLLPNLQNLDGWPTERMEVETEPADGRGAGEKALVSIQEAFSDLDSLVVVKRDISSQGGGGGGGGSHGDKYLEELCADVGPWVEPGYWDIDPRGLTASGAAADNYVDSVDKDLANVLKQCKRVCERGKELRQGLTK